MKTKPELNKTRPISFLIQPQPTSHATSNRMNKMKSFLKETKNVSQHMV